MLTIQLLKHYPHAIPELAEIWYDALGKTCAPDIPISEIASWMHEWHHTNTLPLAHIALHGDKPIGICSLQVNDGIRPDLMPWLGDLCVDPSYQKQGVGKKLIHATKEKAKALGFSQLYLYTFDQRLPNYYKTFGWQTLGMDRYKEHPVTVMQILL